MIPKFANTRRETGEDQEPFLGGIKATPSRLSRQSRSCVFVFVLQWAIIATLCAFTAHQYTQLRQHLPQNGDVVYCKLLFYLAEEIKC